MRLTTRRQALAACAGLLAAAAGPALAQFEVCKGVLADELGVEPDPATVALAEQIGP